MTSQRQVSLIFTELVNTPCVFCEFVFVINVFLTWQQVCSDFNITSQTTQNDYTKLEFIYGPLSLLYGANFLRVLLVIWLDFKILLYLMFRSDRSSWKVGKGSNVFHGR